MGRGPLLAAAGLALSACTTINISGAQGVETHRHFGFAAISLTPGAAGAWVRTKGYGLALTQNGASLGLVEERAFITHNASACSVFLIVETPADEERVRQHFIPVLSEQHDICFTNGE